MAVNFYLDKRTDKHGDCPIRVSISIFGARFISSTGYKVAPTKWDQNKQQVKKGSTAGAGVTYSTINAALAKLSEHFSAYEHQCMLDKIKPTSAEIRKELLEHFARKKATGEKQALIFDYFELYYSEVPRQNQWSLSTCKSFHKMVNYIDEFDHNLTFGRLTEKRLNDFVLFLRETITFGNCNGLYKLFFIPCCNAFSALFLQDNEVTPYLCACIFTEHSSWQANR